MEFPQLFGFHTHLRPMVGVGNTFVLETRVTRKTLSFWLIPHPCWLLVHPRIDDSLNAMSGAWWFSSGDLQSGFHQHPMVKESRPYTAFVTKHGVFQWKVVPQGIQNGPSLFQRSMCCIFR
jgi:hypothetical protein